MKLPQNECRWLWIASLLLALLLGLPFLLAFVQQGGDWHFSGFLIAVEDGNSYIAKMLRGANGEWLFRSPYSTVEQSGTLIYLPYLLLGKLLGPTASHAAFLAAFHLSRIVSIFMLSFASYRFISLFIKGISWRRFAWLLSHLGGGLGWLLLVMGQENWLGSLPLDLFSPESFGFLALFTFPHLSMGRALMLFAFTYFLSKEEQTLPTWQIVLLWLLMGLVHVISAALALLVVCVYWLYTAITKQGRAGGNFWSGLQIILWPIVGASLPIVLNLLALWRDPYLRAWSAQNLITTPHPLHYLAAYGLLAPFAFLGFRLLRDAKHPRVGFLGVWLLLVAALLFVPLGLQRRFAEGIWLAIVVLACSSFEGKRPLARQWTPWIAALILPTTIILLIGSLQIATTLRQPVFLDREKLAAFERIDSLAKKNQVVLSTYQLGNALPAYAPVRVVIGHGPESVGFQDLSVRVDGVLDGDLNISDQNFLNEQTVDFILSPLEFATTEGLSLIEVFPEASLWLYQWGSAQ